MSQKRYVATVTFYVYADNDEQAFKDANHVAKNMDKKFTNDCHEPDLEQLSEQPFGTLDVRELDVPQYKRDF